MRILTILVATSFYMKASPQSTELETRLEVGELKMRYPAIYFIHGTTNYAPMPYTVDSCFKFILVNWKEIQDFNIWRDSAEGESLSRARSDKLRKELLRYKARGNLSIHSMRDRQKLSQRTISLASSRQERQFLLSINSVFEFSTAKIAQSKVPNKSFGEKSHFERPRLWCFTCWKHGFFIRTKMKVRKAMKKNK